jgi:riboflavin kinase/FMN adenylyltransferase
VDRARADSAVSAVVTFDPHPLKVLRPQQAPCLLQTVAQKLAAFSELGLDAALVLSFDLSLAAISPEEFVRTTIVEGLRARAVLVGNSFRFGHKQAGDTALLQQLGARLGFDVSVVRPALVDGEVVSSSGVRACIVNGDVARAARMLGRPFVLTGEIVRGAGRGSTIVVPTLNLAPEQECLPKPGVYATETLVAGRLYRSATNIGVRPTFDGQGLSIESHLFDFSEVLTSGRLEVRFWQRLRDEKRFSGAPELVRQIALDLEQARAFFARRDESSAANRPT